MAKAYRMNVVHDMTLTTPKSAMRRANMFMNSGYEVSGYYMHLPPQEAAGRP